MKEALDWTAIQAGYESGHSIASLARNYGVSTSAIAALTWPWDRPDGDVFTALYATQNWLLVRYYFLARHR